MNTHDEVKAICWMIRHYQSLADSCWDIYTDITDAYLVYDHYMISVKMYQDRLYAIFD